MEHVALYQQWQENQLDEVAALTLLRWVEEWCASAPEHRLNDQGSLLTVDLYWPARSDKPLLQVDGFGRIWFYHDRLGSDGLLRALEGHFGDVFGELEPGPVSCLRPKFWQGALPELSQLLKQHL
ncbi:hypothetical protein [Aeromonas simiae]|uniref:Uncharacterized protein n=1 Tax=Aeromonas simiae TaxID=218936 RepID=A0A5J6WUY1_9GAMM|nr:hypothetical protein [Aeromonas simiae]MDO2948774.1 hypothetical protein [Aeromonas simiae]MDO2951845.1 hypothetical protein [Aeromonas simiae]MDO2956157.1 hypothetical protein [Aeromonas simiae]QFI54949.1 hypothetical protein FE240_09790 [Aeromonas simiae]